MRLYAATLRLRVDVSRLSALTLLSLKWSSLVTKDGVDKREERHRRQTERERQRETDREREREREENYPLDEIA